jgi:hypothetical protein
MFFLFSFAVMAKPQPDFTHVDRHARTLSKASSFEKTAEELTAPFGSETEKARAIFVWITDNIRYDIQKFRRQQTHPKKERIFADSRAELEQIRRSRQVEMARKAFRSGKGVCEDYSYLFQFMAGHIGLEAVFIPGYGRFSPSTISRLPERSNHAWNAVKLEGEWYLLDATWAAGTTDMSKGVFTKDFQEGLFMAPPNRFLLSHYPEDPRWQLLDQPVNKESFSRLPYAFPALSDPGILGFFPEIGIIRRTGESVRVGLETTDPGQTYLLILNRRTSGLKPEMSDNRLVFEIPAAQMEKGELTLAILDGNRIKPLISYLVI